MIFFCTNTFLAAEALFSERFDPISPGILLHDTHFFPAFRCNLVMGVASAAWPGVTRVREMFVTIMRETLACVN